MLKELDKLSHGQKLGSRAVHISHLLANTKPKYISLLKEEYMENDNISMEMVKKKKGSIV